MIETNRHPIRVEALTAAAFAPFGDVIAVGDAARQFSINEGFATRFHDLAHIDVLDQGGRPILNIFRATPRVLPMQLRVMERHPLGSQAFMPLSSTPYLVVVAPASPTLVPEQIRCFLAQAGQGVNYAKGTWHHPLIATERASDFLVVDRGGRAEDHNLDEVDVLALGYWIG
ncbi:ureidoglycolate lyase [Rhodoferax saidenbachensis]|uniref:ureidoglycolate lyase n=1 Tax=Rhodoferax saidenbachensis TaxID=1484693 RepID=UPI0004BC5854|nr:ureidoglycolate lyase [Rhodoferax saidenbachensis]